MSGVICANYGHLRESTRSCDGVWYDRCYRQHPKDSFPGLRAADLEDALMDAEDDGEGVDDPERFKSARSRDYLMCPFPCDWCSFYKIKSGYPVDSGAPKNKLLLICIRRAILDLFWSRERSTVSKNRTEIQALVTSSVLLGIPNPLPPQGPCPFGDIMGMGTACALLMKTLHAGRNSIQIQFETARKIHSAVSNFVHTTPYGAGASVVSNADRGSLFISGSATNSIWFRRFMAGCHQRMGDVWMPDRAVTYGNCIRPLDHSGRGLYGHHSWTQQVGDKPYGCNAGCGIHCA
ncbi:hypothetical protein ACA910_004820 [Epithemia clementina (nom. ined.)]